jgi:hypothetical protein
MIYAKHIAKAHTNFLTDVGYLINIAVPASAGTTIVTPNDHSAVLQYRGTDIQFKQLVVSLRLIPSDELNVIVEVSGTHDGKEIFDTISFHVDRFAPEALATLVLARYRTTARVSNA